MDANFDSKNKVEIKGGIVMVEHEKVLFRTLQDIQKYLKENPIPKNSDEIRIYGLSSTIPLKVGCFIYVKKEKENMKKQTSKKFEPGIEPINVEYSKKSRTMRYTDTSGKRFLPLALHQMIASQLPKTLKVGTIHMVYPNLQSAKKKKYYRVTIVA